MIRLDEQQGVALSATIRDLANLVAAALVLGQFVGDRSVSWGLMAVGGAAWIGLVMVGLLLARSRR